MYEKFTDRARKVMQLANQEAQRFNHEYIDSLHVLIGLSKEGSGVAATVLNNLDVDLRKIRLAIEARIPADPDKEIILGKLPHTDATKRVVEYSVDEARKLNHNYVGTEHLLLGLLREEKPDGILSAIGLGIEQVREETMALLGHRPAAAQEGFRVNRWVITGEPSSPRSGYYYRLEGDAGCFEIGFKTHAELMAYVASRSPKAAADEPIIK